MVLDCIDFCPCCLFLLLVFGRPKDHPIPPHQVGSTAVPSELVSLFLFVDAICNIRYETFVYGRATIHAIPTRLLSVLTYIIVFLLLLIHDLLLLPVDMILLYLVRRIFTPPHPDCCSFLRSVSVVVDS